ncbi:CPBP family intramembrane glutamic endopeptidase [Candidatus Cardinium hertigii]|uniref:CPBP family intramembrane glutamic endopeptidase n=1 Tax=Candidatus Cardinium hertigii TaxID=247481 RepID=UPI003D7E0039
MEDSPKKWHLHRIVYRFKFAKKTPFIDLIWDIAMLLCIWFIFNYLNFYTNAILKRLIYSLNEQLKLSEQLIYAIPNINVSTWSLAIPIVYLKYVLKPLGSVIINNCKFSIRILFTSTLITIVLFILHMLVVWNRLDINCLYKHFNFISEYAMKSRLLKLGFLSAEILDSSYSSFSHFLWNGIIVHSLRVAIFEELIFRGIFQYIFFRYTKNQLLSIIITSILFTAYHLNINQVIPFLFAGMFFGYIYYITNNNMFVVMWVHFLYNTIFHTMHYSNIIYLYQKIARLYNEFTLLQSVVCILSCMCLIYILLYNLKGFCRINFE